MNLFEKLSAITAELGTVAKNLNVATGRNQSYKAVSERDVLDAVKPMEAKYGIYSYPASRETLESEQFETENEYQGKVTKRTTFYTRIKTIYRFVNIEKPEEYIDTTVFSVGIDSQDKGDGKAMTYGDKYALMKAYKISTGDDPDQDGSVEVQYKPRTYNRTSYPPLSHDADGTEFFVCSDCKKTVKAVTKKDGSTMSAAEMLTLSVDRVGRELCPDCLKRALDESKNR